MLAAPMRAIIAWYHSIIEWSMVAERTDPDARRGLPFCRSRRAPRSRCLSRLVEALSAERQILREGQVVYVGFSSRSCRCRLAFAGYR